MWVCITQATGGWKGVQTWGEGKFTLSLLELRHLYFPALDICNPGSQTSELNGSLHWLSWIFVYAHSSISKTKLLSLGKRRVQTSSHWLWVLIPGLPRALYITLNHLKNSPETSLVVQWLRIHLSRQGAWATSLFGELRSCMLWGNEAHVPQQDKPTSCD